MAKSDYKDWEKSDLVKEVERLRKRKKYGLVWEDKPEDVVEQCKSELPVLDEVEDKEIQTDPDKPVNLLIEGDNYHALSVLNYTHRGKVDVIYIDPPYNTGNKDFIYNDHYVDSDDAYRHSKWLSFMSRRLRLAKSLLKKNGAIFVSINEEELAQLKLLCDDIFQEKNYLTTFTVKVRHEDRILKGDKDFHEVVEYLLLYQKTGLFRPLKKTRDNTSIDDYVYEVKELSKPSKMKCGANEVEVFKPDQFELVKGEASVSKFKRINIRGSIKEGNSSGRFYMKYLDSFKNERSGYLFKVPNMGADKYDFRYFMTPTGRRVNGDYFQGVPVDREDTIEIPLPNYLDFEYEFNNVGYEGGIDFRNGKKPVAFVKRLLEIARCADKKDAIIVDFFAGSGSTGHAVLELNQDGGTRRFILSTNNEDNNGSGKVAEDFCYPRIKNAIFGYKLRNQDIEGMGGNLKYFRTSFVPAEPTDKNKTELTEKATEMLCVREDTFELVKDEEKFKIFKGKDHHTGIIFDQLAIDDFKKAIARIDSPFSMYVFSLGDDTFDDEFADVINKVTLSPIPEAILRVYRRIFS